MLNPKKISNFKFVILNIAKNLSANRSFVPQDDKSFNTI
jgi:hypothetical protein